MYIIFERDSTEWVIRKELLISDGENLVFNLGDKSDCQQIAEILNEYEDMEDDDE